MNQSTFSKPKDHVLREALVLFKYARILNSVVEGALMFTVLFTYCLDVWSLLTSVKMQKFYFPSVSCFVEPRIEKNNFLGCVGAKKKIRALVRSV